nr:hypothetical protein [Actinomycetota bacterium]
LRSYADYLELDGSALVATYRERNAERDLPPAAARPSALPPPRRSRVAVGAVAAALAVAAVLGLALAGEEQERPAEPSAVAPSTPSPVATPPSPAPAKIARAAAPSLALTAARGDSWLEVRFRGTSWKLVWTGTLRRRRTLRRGLRRALWIRAGAPEALAATIGGRRVRFPPGAREVVAEAEGIRVG